MTSSRAVLLLAAILFLSFLGSHDLWAPDEPYFAEGAREMLVDGHWAVPHVNGVVTSDKPPMFFWLIALFSLPVGAVTSWTARLPSALAALGTVALTVRLGRRFFGPRTAALAGLVLSTTYLFWEKARWAQTDSLLCFLIWVALSAFDALRSREAGVGAALLFWLAAALAVLVKGPVGLVLPAGIALTILLIDKEPSGWRVPRPAWGALVLLAVVGGWMALATIGGHGEYSVWGAFQKHVVQRAVFGMHHRRPPWYYLEVLPVNLLPWTALIPASLLLAWKRRSPSDRFLLVAALFVVSFFSLVTEKRELYVLPAFPAFALLVAGVIGAVCRWGEPEAGSQHVPDRRWVTVGQGILGGSLVVVGLVLPLACRHVEELTAWMVLTLAVLFIVGGMTTILFAHGGRILGAATAPAACCAVTLLFVAGAVYPAFEPHNSARPLALRIAAATAASRAAGLPILALGTGNLPEAFSFYSNGIYMKETNDPMDLVRHVERSERVFAIVNRRALDGVPPDLLGRLWVVDRARLNEKDLLLVTNTYTPGAKSLMSIDSSTRRGG